MFGVAPVKVNKYQRESGVKKSERSFSTAACTNTDGEGAGGGGEALGGWIRLMGLRGGAQGFVMANMVK